jgi:dihydroxy-acid dehydratase
VTRGILEVKRGSGTFVKNPELDNGDPLGLSKIEIDIEARKIAVIGINGEKRTPEEIDDILAKRKANWKGFTSKYKKGLLKLYAQHAQSPMKGAYME